MNENNAPAQHHTMNDTVVSECIITFLMMTASIAVRTIANIRYCISGLFSSFKEKPYSVVSKMK